MAFYDRFELLELLRDDGVKTFRATENSTGRVVEAHLFVNPHAPLSVALRGRLKQLPEAQRAQILAEGNHEGTPYVVTLPIVGYPGFREWVSAKRPPAAPAAPAASPAPPPLPPPIAPAAGAPGEFTRMFRPSPPAASPPPPPAAQPGEFTRMFQGPKPTAPAPPQSPPPLPTPANPPGEFTRMFRGPQPPASPPALPANDPDGDRTQRNPVPKSPGESSE